MAPAPVALQAAPSPHPFIGWYSEMKIYNNGIVSYVYLSSSNELYNLQEALSTPHWKATMEDEYNALMRNKT
jgi:hypothetical protein